MKSKLQTVPKLIRSVVSEYGLFKLSFSITNICNLRCKNCNIWRTYNESSEKLAEELTSDEYRKIFAQLPKSLSIIEFTGGEPFLRPDFQEILVSSLTLVNPRQIYIPTNGFAVEQIANTINGVVTSKEWRASCSEITVGVSIDGFADSHDYLRGLNGVYSRAWKTFELLNEISHREPRLKCFISSTLFNYSIRNGNLFGFLKMLNDRHIPYGIQNCNSSEYYSLTQNETIPLEISETVNVIKEKVIPVHTSGLLSKFYWHKTIDFLKNPEKFVLPCPALKMFCAVDPYGNVWPCLMWPQKIANLRNHNYDLKNLLCANKGKVKDFIHIINKEKCPNCWTPCTSGQRITYCLLTKPWRLLSVVRCLR